MGLPQRVLVHVRVDLRGGYVGVPEQLLHGAQVGSAGQEVRRRIGYMPDVFSGDPELTVDAYLEFFARIWRIPPRAAPPARR